MIINILLLLFLFLVLSFSADMVINKIKIFGKKFKVPLFLFGIFLGIITTLPEFFLGINSLIKGVPGLLVGNLLGGIMVVLGFVLGFTTLLNGKIKTEKGYQKPVFSAIFIFLPFLLGIDGQFSRIDGLIILVAYLLLILFVYRKDDEFEDEVDDILDETKKRESLFETVILAGIGILGILLTSHFIVEIAETVLNSFAIRPLLIGVFIFSIGTNLPEITISLTAWRKNSAEISLGHLLSSAMANILFLGIFAIIKTVSFSGEKYFWDLSFFAFLLLVAFAVFFQTGQKINRKEGAVLLFLYLMFILSTVYL